MRKRELGKPMTAGELMAKLRQDPVFVAREREIEAREKENSVEYRRHAAPLLEELALNRFLVGSVGELRHKRLNYERAIPILVKWLPLIADPNVKEDIVRTLSVKWTPPEVALLLIKEFYRTNNPGLRWAIGNAVEIIADDQSYEAILGVVREKAFGGSRQMFVRALARWKTPAVAMILKSLLEDQKEVAIPSIEILGAFGNQECRNIIEPLTKHTDLQVRQAARTALGS